MHKERRSPLPPPPLRTSLPSIVARFICSGRPLPPPKKPFPLLCYSSAPKNEEEEEEGGGTITWYPSPPPPPPPIPWQVPPPTPPPFLSFFSFTRSRRVPSKNWVRRRRRRFVWPQKRRGGMRRRGIKHTRCLTLSLPSFPPLRSLIRGRPRVGIQQTGGGEGGKSFNIAKVH